MVKTIGHTFDQQPESTTYTEYNKYYDGKDPNMKLTNIFRVHGTSYRHTGLNIATSAVMFLVSPGITAA